MLRLRAGWLMFSSAAALEKLPVRATEMSCCSFPEEMVIPGMHRSNGIQHWKTEHGRGYPVSADAGEARRRNDISSWGVSHVQTDLFLPETSGHDDRRIQG